MKEVSFCMVRKRTHSYQVKRKHAISDEESPIQTVRIRRVSKAWEEHEIDGASRSSRLGSSRLTNEDLAVQPPIPKQLSHPMQAQRQSDIHRRGYIYSLLLLFQFFLASKLALIFLAPSIPFNSRTWLGAWQASEFRVCCCRL